MLGFCVSVFVIYAFEQKGRTINYNLENKMLALSTLPNIGAELEKKLKVVGIETAEDLKSLGSKQAFLKLKDIYPQCLSSSSSSPTRRNR